MKIMKKIFCRSFQFVLRLALPVLPYRDPKVVNSVENIPQCLKEKKIRNVLIVTDGFLHLSGMLEPMKKALKNAQICYTIYDEVTPNLTILNVELARERYLANHCQGLIGFGGGSAIDCAKAVGARIARPRLSIPRMKGILKIWLPIPYLIAVPTTAGTGSETTLATVITDHNTTHKFPINDFPLIPRVAVLDPEMTRKLPPHLTATTGMDALTHAIEAYIGGSTTAGTRAAALEAARLIAENLEKAYHDGNDMTARANMLKAAFLAGGAFSKSYVGYCHAVAHSLGPGQRGAAAICAGRLWSICPQKVQGYCHRDGAGGGFCPGGRGCGAADRGDPPYECRDGYSGKAVRDQNGGYSQAGPLCG